MSRSFRAQILENLSSDSGLTTPYTLESISVLMLVIHELVETKACTFSTFTRGE